MTFDFILYQVCKHVLYCILMLLWICDYLLYLRTVEAIQRDKHGLVDQLLGWLLGEHLSGVEILFSYFCLSYI